MSKNPQTAKEFVAEVGLTENQIRILGWANSPSGPLLAPNEIILNTRQDKRDGAWLARHGLMSAAHERDGNTVRRITGKGGNALRAT